MGKQTRTKRGLANFIRDISKTLFGTLNENNLGQIDHEFNKICKDNKNVATVLSNHTKIPKLILDSLSVNHKELINNQNNGKEKPKNLRFRLNFISTLRKKNI